MKRSVKSNSPLSTAHAFTARALRKWGEKGKSYQFIQSDFIGGAG